MGCNGTGRHVNSTPRQERDEQFSGQLPELNNLLHVTKQSHSLWRSALGNGVRHRGLLHDVLIFMIGTCTPPKVECTLAMTFCEDD